MTEICQKLLSFSHLLSQNLIKLRFAEISKARCKHLNIGEKQLYATQEESFTELVGYAMGFNATCVSHEIKAKYGLKAR